MPHTCPKPGQYNKVPSRSLRQTDTKPPFPQDRQHRVLGPATAAGGLVVPALTPTFLHTTGGHSHFAPTGEDEIQSGTVVSQHSSDVENGTVCLARKHHTELGTESNGLAPAAELPLLSYALRDAVVRRGGLAGAATGILGFLKATGETTLLQSNI